MVLVLIGGLKVRRGRSFRSRRSRHFRCIAGDADRTDNETTLIGHDYTVSGRKLITGRLPIDRINEGLDALRRGEAIRTVIDMERP